MKASGTFHPDPFTWVAASASLVILAFILLPLVAMVTQPTAADLVDTLADKDVFRAIWSSAFPWAGSSTARWHT